MGGGSGRSGVGRQARGPGRPPGPGALGAGAPLQTGRWGFENMAYVVQFSTGHVRLFNSREDALAYEKRGHPSVGHGIVADAEVNGAHHYRGKIPRNGVGFGPSDQSHAQLLGAMAYGE